MAVAAYGSSATSSDAQRTAPDRRTARAAIGLVRGSDGPRPSVLESSRALPLPLYPSWSNSVASHPGSHRRGWGRSRPVGPEMYAYPAVVGTAEVSGGAYEDDDRCGAGSSLLRCRDGTQNRPGGKGPGGDSAYGRRANFAFRLDGRCGRSRQCEPTPHPTRPITNVTSSRPASHQTSACGVRRCGGDGA
jgi:hypothetical protein